MRWRKRDSTVVFVDGQWLVAALALGLAAALVVRVLGVTEGLPFVLVVAVPGTVGVLVGGVIAMRLHAVELGDQAVRFKKLRPFGEVTIPYRRIQGLSFEPYQGHVEHPLLTVRTDEGHGVVPGGSSLSWRPPKWQRQLRAELEQRVDESRPNSKLHPRDIHAPGPVTDFLDRDPPDS